MAGLLRLPHGGLQAQHARVRGPHPRQEPAQVRPHQPRRVLLLPGHVQGVGEDGREGGEVSAEDAADVPPLAQVQRREEADEVPRRAGGHHRGPAQPRQHPLPAVTLPGGHRHLQADPPRQQGTDLYAMFNDVQKGASIF